MTDRLRETLLEIVKVTVPNKKECLKLVARLQDLLDDEKALSERQGHAEGHQEGIENDDDDDGSDSYLEGRSDGFEEGRRAGYDEGYDVGYDIGREEDPVGEDA